MKENILLIIKSIKIFFSDYFFVRSTFRLAILSLIVSIIYIKYVTPEFLISTELTVTQESNTPSSFEQRSLTSILSLGSNNRPQDEFMVNAYSISNAKYLWDLGYPQEIFASLYDSDSNSFRPKKVTILNRLASFIVGYEINSTLEVTDLQNFIRSRVKISSNEITKIINIKMQYHDPALAKRLVYDLIIGADVVAKNYVLDKSESRVTNILEDLNTNTHPQIIKEGLVDIVNRNLFKITSAESDAPLSVNFIQEPVSSQNPVFPRPFLIIFCFIFITLAVSYFIKFLKRNKNELSE